MNAGGVDKACKSNGCSSQHPATSDRQLITRMSFRYRKLRIYQEAINFHRLIVKLTKKFPIDFDYLRKQLRRSSLSTALNIAEGSAKNSDKDFRRYIGISLGSMNESMAGCEVALAESLISSEEFQSAEFAAENLVKQLGSFSKKLK